MFDVLGGSGGKKREMGACEEVLCRSCFAQFTSKRLRIQHRERKRLRHGYLPGNHKANVGEGRHTVFPRVDVGIIHHLPVGVGEPWLLCDKGEGEMQSKDRRINTVLD